MYKYTLRLIIYLLFVGMSPTQAQIINTIAGMGGSGYNGDGITATSAQLYAPSSTAMDGSGNIYICEQSNNRVRKINTSGVITTIAGTGNDTTTGDSGPATAAGLNKPNAIALDGSNNIYIACASVIRKVNTSGVISTIAGTGTAGYSGDGGAATAAAINVPNGVVVDAGGNLFFTDGNNNRVRKINTSGTISTIAGTGTASLSGDGGPATAATISKPYGITINASGELLFSDMFNYRIRKINSSGIISTIAGSYPGYSGDGGAATAAYLNNPAGIALDGSGNLYVTDLNNANVRKINTSGIITTVAGVYHYSWYGFMNGWYNGDGIAATAAFLNHPSGVMTDGSGNIYIADKSNDRLRKVNTSGTISTLAGMGNPGYSGDGGAATAAQLLWPKAMCFDHSGNLYVADQANHCIRKITPAGIITTICGIIHFGYDGDGWPATAARLYNPSSIAIDRTGNIFIADRDNRAIRKIDTFGIIHTIAGGGSSTADGVPSTAASVSLPSSLALDTAGNLYYSEYAYDRIRKINTSGIVYTVAGNASSGFSGDGGAATAAQLYRPLDIAFDRSGNLLITDAGNYRVRKVTPSGIISTVIGTGSTIFSGDGGAATAAGIDSLDGLATDTSGNIYISEYRHHRVRKVNASGIITTIAGNGLAAYTGNGGSATAAGVCLPSGLMVDSVGNLFIADKGNNTIRKITICLPPVAGSITGSSVLCAGSSLTLTDTSSGGSWSSGNIAIASVSATGVVSGVSAGNDTVYYTVTNTCGTARAMHLITVNPLPAVGLISGVPTLCAGSSITLTDTTAGGTWSSSSAIATVSTTGTVSGLSAGIVVISYAVTNSCGTTYMPDTVRVFGLPSLTSPATATVCDSILFNYTPTSDSSGATFAWTRPVASGISNAVGSGTSSIAEFLDNVTTSPINVIYVFTISKNGCANTQNLTVTMNPTPQAVMSGKDTICENDTANLSFALTGGTGTWSCSCTSVSTVFTGTGTSVILSGIGAGSCTIQYNLTQNGCINTLYFPLTILSAADCPTGIAVSEHQKQDVWLAMSPNPNNGACTLQLQSGITEIAEIVITNLLGKKAAEFSMMTNQPTAMHLPLPAGIYFVRAITKNEQVFSKMVISRQ